VGENSTASATGTSRGVWGRMLNISSAEGSLATYNSTIGTIGVYGSVTAGATNYSGYFTGGKVYSASNVGIGVTSPVQMLDVNGDVNVATGQGFRVNNGATSGQYLRGNGSNVVMSAIQAADVPTLNQNTTGYAGSVFQSISFSSSGGASPGTTYNGSVARLISFATVGAPSTTGSGASGTWGISITGNAATASSATAAVFASSATTATTVSDGAITAPKLSGAQTGSAPVFGARAWVIFDGTGSTGTNMSLYGSGNIASVYKNGTGDFTVTFTTALPNANYAVVGGANGRGDGYSFMNHSARVANLYDIGAGVTKSTSSVRIATGLAGGSGSVGALEDCSYTSLVFFG